MYWRLALLSLASLFLTSAPVAQNSRLNGTWKAPIVLSGREWFFTYTFKVEGDTFTGTEADPGHAPIPFADGKIQDGNFSFSVPELNRYIRGTIKDDTHLELRDDLCCPTYKAVRKPGVVTPPNTLEGEWVMVPTLSFNFHVNGEKLEGAAIFDGTPMPFIEGSVRSNQIRFLFINTKKGDGAFLYTGALTGDHLQLFFDLERIEHAVKVDPSKAQSVKLDPARLARYRSLIETAMDSVKKHDMATASKTCQTIEQEFDHEQELHANSPEVWDQIDKAMDGFIQLILRSEGKAPNAAALDQAYKDFLSKLKLAE